jgi:membrane associated rhomboid family serine protease
LTKKDLRSIGWAAAIAAFGGGLIYWFGVRRKMIAEIAPVEIHWESQ